MPVQETQNNPAIKKKKKKWPVVVSLISLLLVSGWYYKQHFTRTDKPTPLPQASYALSPITVNLSGYSEHFLRFKAVLLFPEPLIQKIKREEYKIVDKIISTLRTDHYLQLIASSGQTLAQRQVKQAADSVVPGVSKVYFTQFLLD